ncbi:MAG: ABC transporter substrate-binding protein [Alphaproteobacteria bacterium]|nr:ABC transporter substrate-binding protein [Alphaproteobacteria bacterium]
MSIRKVLLAIVIALVSFFVLKQTSNKNTSASFHHDLPVIAITQIIEHSALDQEREGVIEALAAAGFVDGKTIKIIYQNAQGNISTATQIATQMAGYHPKVMVALSTSSAQAALPTCMAQHIPLVFSAVTDPLAAKLVKNLEKREEAVTGVSDALSVESQIDLLLQFLPTLKRLGVLYNAGEVNSVIMVKKLRDGAQKQGIQLVEATTNRTSEASIAMENLVGKVDAVYVPNDNTVVAAMNSIVQIAEKHKLPLFAADTGSVAAGAIATRGYDRRVLGKIAGDIVVRILKGESAGAIPVAINHPLFTLVNTRAAQKVGLAIPPVVEQTAIQAHEEGK